MLPLLENILCCLFFQPKSHHSHCIGNPKNFNIPERKENIKMPKPAISLLFDEKRYGLHCLFLDDKTTLCNYDFNLVIMMTMVING